MSDAPITTIPDGSVLFFFFLSFFGFFTTLMVWGVIFGSHVNEFLQLQKLVRKLKEMKEAILGHE